MYGGACKYLVMLSNNEVDSQKGTIATAKITREALTLGSMKLAASVGASLAAVAMSI